jgi:hypothetical protein
MLKLLQEIRGFAEIVNRCPTPRSPGLLFMHSRTQAVHVSLPKRRLNVTTDVEDHRDTPYPVKINHVEQNTVPAATPPPP